MSDPFASANAAEAERRRKEQEAHDAVLQSLGAPLSSSSTADRLREAEARRREKRAREGPSSSGPPISPTGMSVVAAPPHPLPPSSSSIPVASVVTPTPPGIAAPGPSNADAAPGGFMARVTRAVLPSSSSSSSASSSSSSSQPPAPLAAPHSSASSNSAPGSRNHSAPVAASSGSSASPSASAVITDAHGRPVDQETADAILAARLQEEELMRAAAEATAAMSTSTSEAGHDVHVGGNNHRSLPLSVPGGPPSSDGSIPVAIPVASYHPSHPPQPQPQQQQQHQQQRGRWGGIGSWFSSSSPSQPTPPPPSRYYANDEPQQQYVGSGPMLIDPVWGAFTPQPPGAQTFTPFQMLGISCCPCCVPPCCIPARKQAWRRFCLSANFILAVIQTILVIVSIALHGFSSQNSMLGPSPAMLNTFQGKNSAEIVYNKQLWRLVTPIFLHAGLLHLAMNMAIQLRLGVLLEYQWGMVPYLFIYFGSGVVGSVYSAIFNADAIGVGASGALLGVFGAWISHMALHWSQGDDYTRRQRKFNLWMALFNVLIIIAFSFSPLIDWAAHLGGLGGGMLLGLWYFGRALDGQVDFDFPNQPSQSSQSSQMASLAAPLSPGGGPRRFNYVGTAGGGSRGLFGCFGRSGGRTTGGASSSSSSPPSCCSKHFASTFNCSKDAVVPCTKGKATVWAGLFGYFVVLVAGLLGLFFNSNPSRALLTIPPY